MRHRASLWLLLFSAPLLALVGACGGDDDGASSGDPPADAGDGKLRPPGNGVRTTEAAACDALYDGYESARQSLGCTVSTSRTCPSLLRAQVGGTACLEYDQGSVSGCVAHYGDQTDCSALAAAQDDCVVTAFAGSDPAGCP
ncbi:MAG TPA: hypothetical protein VLS89_06515 [Candidatus Nanopelagicales bacterium]|nr:hypothetical protein [Candidatus Nanopelagicales bacterium]